jgi:hypothetical protein
MTVFFFVKSMGVHVDTSELQDSLEGACDNAMIFSRSEAWNPLKWRR